MFRNYADARWKTCDRRGYSFEAALIRCFQLLFLIYLVQQFTPNCSRAEFLCSKTVIILEVQDSDISIRNRYKTTEKRIFFYCDGVYRIQQNYPFSALKPCNFFFPREKSIP